MHRASAGSWLKRYGESIRIRSYEALVADPESDITALLDYCDLTHESNCFEYHRSKGPVLTPSAAQVSQPVYSHSVDQWRRYEAWLPDDFFRLGETQGTGVKPE